MPLPWPPPLQRLVYEDTEGDEVEDLACLLAYVKQRHPEVTAVSSGAIASGEGPRLGLAALPRAGRCASCPKTLALACCRRPS